MEKLPMFSREEKWRRHVNVLVARGIGIREA